MESTQPKQTFDPTVTVKENFPNIVKPDLNDFVMKGCKIDLKDKE